jgi:RNA polymerase sigma-70 factor (sigma-E family)
MAQVIEPGQAERRHRDEEFSDFVAARSAALVRYAYLLTGSKEAAEDLVQTTLLRLYTNWDKLRAREAMDQWCRTTITRCYLSLLRRASSREILHGDMPERAASSDTDRVDSVDELWCHLASLPRRQRAVLVLRFYLDYSEHEAADAMGCSLGTVKSQTHRALSSLRSRVIAERPVAAEELS